MLQSDPVHFLNGKVDKALQKALSLQDEPEKFREVILQLRKHADEAFHVIPPIWPQKRGLRNFVKKSMDSFPNYFGSCLRDTTLLHHLQRYGACYLAYKTGYFERMNHTRQPSPTRTYAESEYIAIIEFLAGCQPPLPHLLDKFVQLRITGELHLRALVAQGESRINEYLAKIATNPFEQETLSQAFENLSMCFK